MQVNTVIYYFKRIYRKAKRDKYIRKPVSYALYYTWRWADVREKPRKNNE